MHINFNYALIINHRQLTSRQALTKQILSVFMLLFIFFVILFLYTTNIFWCYHFIHTILPQWYQWIFTFYQHINHQQNVILLLVSLCLFFSVLNKLIVFQKSLKLVKIYFNLMTLANTFVFQFYVLKILVYLVNTIDSLALYTKNKNNK